MADLRTDYKDDILDTSVNTQRKYRVVNNDDETVSFVDETVYTQNGDTFGASDVNAITKNLTSENGVSFNFAYNEETNEYGYMAKVEGADTFFPFSNAKKLYEALQYSGLVTEDMTFDEMCEVLANHFPPKFNLLSDVPISLYNLSRSGNTFNSYDGSSITCTMTWTQSFGIKSGSVLNIVGNNLKKEYSQTALYVEVSTDNGVNWTNLGTIPLPTNTYQGGSFSKSFSLSSYNGKTVKLRLRWITHNPTYKCNNSFSTIQLNI